MSAWAALQPGLGIALWSGALAFYQINEDTVTAVPRMWTYDGALAAILQVSGRWFAIEYSTPMAVPYITEGPTFGHLLSAMPGYLRYRLGVPLPGDDEVPGWSMNYSRLGNLSCNSSLGPLFDDDPPEAHTFRSLE